MTNEDVITAFRQTNAGNCVSVATIKAAIQVLGVDQVFAAVDRINHDEAYLVQTRDSRQFIVSREEREYARTRSRFKLSDTATEQQQAVFRTALFCFAVMAKVAQYYGNDRRGPKRWVRLGYDEAVVSLNNGEDTRSGPILLGVPHVDLNAELGLDSHLPSKKLLAAMTPEVQGRKGVVAASKKHAYFVSEGLVDWYGKPISFADVRKRKRRITRHFFQITEEGSFPPFWVPR